MPRTPVVSGEYACCRALPLTSNTSTLGLKCCPTASRAPSGEKASPYGRDPPGGWNLDTGAKSRQIVKADEPVKASGGQSRTGGIAHRPATQLPAVRVRRGKRIVREAVQPHAALSHRDNEKSTIRCVCEVLDVSGQSSQTTGESARGTVEQVNAGIPLLQRTSSASEGYGPRVRG